MSKVLKWGVAIGAGVIVALFLLVFYVSLKVKNELQNNLDRYAFHFNQRSEEMISAIGGMNGVNRGQVKLNPFVCKGFLSYECVSKLTVDYDKNNGFSIDHLVVSFQEIRTNSMKMGLSGKVVFDNNESEARSELIPQNFKIINSFVVRDRRSGEIENEVALNFNAPKLDGNLQADYKIRNAKLANKNIIKAIQIILAENGDLASLDLEYMIRQFKLSLNGDVQESIFASMRRENGILTKKDFDTRIDSFTQIFNQLLPGLGVSYIDNLEGLRNIAIHFAKFIKSEEKTFSFSVESREEGWGKVSDLQFLSTNQLFTKLDQYFIFKDGP